MPNVADAFYELRRKCHRLKKRSELLSQSGFVGKRKINSRFIHKEIERVIDGHLGNQFHFHAELVHFFGKQQPRVPVRERVLLPINEVLSAGHALRIAQDPGPAVRGRAQPNHVRTVADRLVVSVLGFVVERDVNGHW